MSIFKSKHQKEKDLAAALDPVFKYLRAHTNGHELFLAKVRETFAEEWDRVEPLLKHWERDWIDVKVEAAKRLLKK